MSLGRCLGLLVMMGCAGYACEASDGDGGSDLRRDFLSDVALKNIVPAYTQVAEQADVLYLAVESFCEAPEQSDLTDVRQAWVDLREVWKRSEVFAFGPIKEYPWRYGPKLDLWPVRPDEIEQTLIEQPWAETADLTLVTGFSKGLPVIEYLVYGVAEGETDSEARFLSNPEACRYLVLLAGDV